MVAMIHTTDHVHVFWVRKRRGNVNYNGSFTLYLLGAGFSKSSQNVRIISQLMLIVVHSKYFYDSDWLKVPGLFFIPATFDQIGDTFVL